MSTVKEHYNSHLGSFYSWMTGEFSSKQAEQQTYFENNGILPQSTSVALDLGAGHGLQSVSLAKLGFTVVAIDFNKQLLQELQHNKNDLPITIIESDITDFSKFENFSPELVVCMGDTLTHLASLSDVKNFLAKTHKYLSSNGKLVLSYRDLSNELQDTQRFIPVKADDNRILTCFLEYFPDYIMVTDLLHEKVEGRWIQKISSYPKLKIPQLSIRQVLRSEGFQVTKLETIRGMLYIIAEKN